MYFPPPLSLLGNKEKQSTDIKHYHCPQDFLNKAKPGLDILRERKENTRTEIALQPTGLLLCSQSLMEKQGEEDTKIISSDYCPFLEFSSI